MSHSYRVSPQNGIQAAAMPVNVYSLASDAGSSEMRKRHNSSSTPRHPSILSGLRNLMVRPRSESLNAQMMRKPPLRPMKKVQVAACQLESVYDLREGEGEATDFYDDEAAFRRPRSNSSDFLILRKTSRPLSVDVVGLVDSQSDPYRQYMKVVECYELAPANNNIIAVDSKLSVDKAFGALCANNVGSALVWDAVQQRMVSIVTLSDFLRLHASPEDPATHPICAILEEQQELVEITTEYKIFDACEVFCNARVHRLIVREPGTGDVMFLLTLKRVLQAIHKQNRSLHFAQWLNCPISDSCVGTWHAEIISASITDSVEVAVAKMLDGRISGLPLVDEKGRAVDVLVKNDLAKALFRTERKDHKDLLSSPIGSIITHRQPADFVNSSDSVGKVLDTLLCGPHVRSVFVVDDHGALKACISLSDVIRHLTVDKTPFQRTPEKRTGSEEEEISSSGPFSP